MRLAVFDRSHVGVVEGETIYDVSSAIPGIADAWPPVFMNHLIARWDELKPRVLEARRAAKPVALDAVRLDAPLPYPGTLVAAPANYRKHIGELGERGVTKAGHSANEIGFFLKAPASIVGPRGPIVLPQSRSRRFDHESELAVIIGRTAKNVPKARALEHVFGYACLMDVTMRIEPGRPAEERPMRKSFDTFTPLGPWIVTADEIPDPQRLQNRLWVNGELRQSASTSDMLVSVAELIELASSVMTLNPGDIIATGTPEGVGPIRPGDSVRMAIESVGEMILGVKEADTAPPRLF